MSANANIPVSLIVAVANGGVIGSKNSLPWKLPEDMRFFKETTMKKPVIMGRLTFDSIGRPLPGRPNIVVTRNSQWEHDNVYSHGNLSSAIEDAKSLISNNSELNNEVMVIGGAILYQEALKVADKVYLTEIDLDVADGDAFFEFPDPKQWELVSCVEGVEGAAIGHRFKTFSRIA